MKPILKQLTLDDIMAKKPCGWDVEGLMAGAESVTVDDIINWDIPDVDKVWAFCRAGWVPEKQKRIFACHCAAGVQPESPKPENITAIETAWKHAHGNATDEELKAASLAAYRAASLAAYWAADRAADRAASEGAEREWQVELIRLILKGWER